MAEFERTEFEDKFIERGHITVCVGQFRYCTFDGGKNWSRSLREIAGTDVPLMQGDVRVAQLPGLTEKWSYDFAAVLDNGFGAAVAHEVADGPYDWATVPVQAYLFLSHDSGFSWKRRGIADLPLRGLTKGKVSSWPPPCFASMSISIPENIVLGWDARWFTDDPNPGISHVISSRDGGDSWRYSPLGDSNAQLTHDLDGRFYCLDEGYFLLSDDSGRTWVKETFDIEWPPSYNDKKVNLLRHLVFLDRNLCYGLVVHWTKNMMASGVGVVVTTDSAKHWRHIATLPPPNFGHVNERHALSLNVGK